MIRVLTPADAAEFRRIRLDALQRHPEAFGASHAEAAQHDEVFYATMLELGIVFAAMRDGRLVGTAAFSIQKGEKARHKGLMWAVYVDPAHRGRRLGEQLVRAVVDHARTRVRVLQCSVVTQNLAARDMYLRLGFRRYGTEHRALCVNGRFLDEDMLEILFDDAGTMEGQP